MSGGPANRCSRRQFLAAGLGAAATWQGHFAHDLDHGRDARATSWAGGPRHGANERIQVAVIGCGRRGSALLDVLMQDAATGAAVIAACDTCRSRQDHVKARHYVPVLADWREAVVREDIDAVMIATPDHCHAEATLAAIEAGKHVYCESPMTRTADEARTLHAAWRRSSRAVQIGVTELSQPGWRKAREIVESGSLGRIAWCQAVSQVDYPAPQWRHCLASSIGSAMQCQFRQLAALLSVFHMGDPVRISAAGGCALDDAGDTPEQMMTTVEYEGGTTLMLTSGAVRSLGPWAILRGDRRAVFVSGQDAAVLPNSAPLPAAVFPTEAQTERAALKAHVADWINAIASGGPCRCSPDTALRAQGVIDAALEAWRCARTVEFGLIRHV